MVGQNQALILPFLYKMQLTFIKSQWEKIPICKSILAKKWMNNIRLRISPFGNTNELMGLGNDGQ